MAATKIKVEYADGHTTVVRVTPRAQVMAEEKFSGLRDPAIQVRASYFLAWASLHKAGLEPDGFDKWLDRIIDAEEIVPRGLPCPVCGAEDVCGSDGDGNGWIHGTAEMRGTEEDDQSSDPTKPTPGTAASSG